MARLERHSGDTQISQPPVIASDAFDERDETIELVDKPLTTDYLTLLKFNEDIMTIRIERGREKHAAKFVDVYVNGVGKWMPVGVPVKLARKFVEVLARSQPFSVETDAGTTSDERPHNRIVRNQYAMHSFSVIHDPSPIGAEWLTRVLMEN